MFYIVLGKTYDINHIRETAMNKHTNQLMLFKDFFGKKVAVDFNVSIRASTSFLESFEWLYYAFMIITPRRKDGTIQISNATGSRDVYGN